MVETGALLLMDPRLFWGFFLTSHRVSSPWPATLDLPKPLWRGFTASLIPGAENNLHDRGNTSFHPVLHFSHSHHMPCIL